MSLVENSLSLSKKRCTLEEERANLLNPDPLRFLRSGSLSLGLSVKIHMLKWLLAFSLPLKHTG